MAAWGAILSTALAGIKILEAWRDRFQVEVSYSSHGDPEIGDKVLIRNLSARPLILTYWQLRWVSGFWPFRSVTRRFDAGPDMTDTRIEPNTTETLHFSGAEYFALGSDPIDIQLDFAGRRSIVRKVCR